MRHSTSPLKPDEDLVLDADTIRGTTCVGVETTGGPYAAFMLANGQVLEFHVPGAVCCLINGPSSAGACSFILRSSDGSIERSGELRCVFVD